MTTAYLITLGLAATSAAGCATQASAAPSTSATAPVPPAPPSPPVIVKADGSRVVILDGDRKVRTVTTQRGHLGLELVEITSELRSHFGAPADAGVMVSRVIPDGPAAKAGVQVGDVVTAIDGRKVDSASDIRQHIRGKSDQDTADIELWRKGARQNVRSTVARKKTDELDLGPLIGRLPHPIVIDRDRINESVEKALRRHHFEWQDHSDRRRSLEDRLRSRTKDLEERIERLERQLDDKRGSRKL